MRPKKLGLIAALAAVALAPAVVHSAQKQQAAVTDADRKAGMAAAPALVQTAGVPCQVSDARLIGKNEDKKAKTSTTFYEVACSGQMGFVLQAPQGGAPSAFNCLESSAEATPGQESALKCKLPANSDPKAGLAPAIAKAGVPCTLENARALGQTKTNSIFEVACQGGAGYVLLTSAPFDASKAVEAQNCLNYDDAQGNIKCTLTEKATRLAVVDRYAQQANVGCTVKDRRYVGTSKGGDNFFEASCQDGKGYIFRVDNKGAVAQNWDCARATQILGGCTLTDAREAATQQAGLYTKLAKSAGSNCDVDRYAVFPPRGTDEVVEMVCKDGKGAVGVFKTNGTGQVLGCGHALAAGYKCSLTQDNGYAALTADLRKHNVKTCTVSNARPTGQTAKGTVFVEVACSDGYKGYLIEYNVNPTVSAVGATGCAMAPGTCKLPGNT
ncbi:hypothetical protein [Phenylobacterium deserti]|uniref:Uncharacterized protein n=1 Tax=Phenylobacterium deserti TaxID=1914756 RepID=A0A328AUZ6_9CAUL|nr:hypothetical protein [Phenylobacterium deserti]RAK56748.1 hypothetical protein DJ018_01885 [Phenylobacterium deserti]